MRVMHNTQLLGELCKALGKPGIFLSFPDWGWANENGWAYDGGWIEEIQKAAPYIDLDDKQHNWLQAIADGEAFILCDSEEEVDEIFNQTRGDDRNYVNTYDGPARIYALTFTADGEYSNENT